MEQPLAPRQTAAASQWIQLYAQSNDPIFGTLLAKVDGHRNVIELESFARALGLDALALERLRQQGLIVVEAPSSS